MEHSPPRGATSVLVAIGLGNLLLDGCIGWPLRSNDMGTAVFLIATFLIVIGLLIGQTLLLAFWIAFAVSRWYWQWGVPPLLCAAIVVACTLSAGMGIAESALIAVAVQGPLWILVALLIPLRRIRGWRLKAGERTLPAEQGRFGIGDLLIWMVVIAVPLAIFRFFTSPGTSGTVTAGMRAIALLGLMLLPLLWLTILVAFASRRWSWFFAGGILIYVVLATAIGAREFYHLVLDPFWWPRPGWILGLWGLLFASLFFTTPSLLVWLNCLGLRQAGWRLVRPAQSR